MGYKYYTTSHYNGVCSSFVLLTYPYSSAVFLEFDSFFPAWYKFKIFYVLEIRLLKLQQFRNSHFPFRIAVESEIFHVLKETRDNLDQEGDCDDITHDVLHSKRSLRSVLYNIPHEGNLRYFLAVMVPQGPLYAVLHVRFMGQFIQAHTDSSQSTNQNQLKNCGWHHFGRPF